MLENVSKKLAKYIKDNALLSDDRPFPICYSTAISLVRRLGKKVNICISHHDLRRYSATHASRNGVPLEIVSKVILRHQDLKTTQVYLGKISDSGLFDEWTSCMGNRIVQYMLREEGLWGEKNSLT